MRAIYPSDITREQFEVIRPILERKRTRPASYDLYDIFCAVLYLLKEGCTWRAIPHDYPKWQNVRYHYDNWAKKDDNGISKIDRALKTLVEMEREYEEREQHTTMLIVDSKSIQNADTAESKGYDAGKKAELNFILLLIFLVYHTLC
jgi:transposase